MIDSYEMERARREAWENEQDALLVLFATVALVAAGVMAALAGAS